MWPELPQPAHQIIQLSGGADPRNNYYVEPFCPYYESHYTDHQTSALLSDLP